MTINFKYVGGFVFFFLVELCIGLFVRDRVIRPFVGDMLVVVLIYCFLRSFSFAPKKHLPLFIFLFACLVEGLQLFMLPVQGVASIILGATFDWLDIGCYGVGCLLLVWWERRLGYEHRSLHK